MHPHPPARADFNDFGCADLRQSCAALPNRRHVLKAGGLGLLGLGLGDLWAARALATATSAAAAGPGFGRARSCIFLFMWGGPSQLDTFDLKPDAPAEVRGPFKPISTRVPGIQICEHFERLANLTDKLAIIRSLNHTDPAHLSSGHATLTGHLAPAINSDAAPPSRATRRTWARCWRGFAALPARCRRSSPCPGWPIIRRRLAAARPDRTAAGWDTSTIPCWSQAIRTVPIGR